MTEDQNRFDEIIREKYSSKHFRFDEENWEQAEEMLDRGIKVKKVWRTATIFLIGLIAGIAIMFPFVREHGDDNNRLVSQTTPATTTETPGVKIENKNAPAVSEPVTKTENNGVKKEEVNQEKYSNNIRSAVSSPVRKAKSIHQGESIRHQNQVTKNTYIGKPTSLDKYPTGSTHSGNKMNKEANIASLNPIPESFEGSKTQAEAKNNPPSSDQLLQKTEDEQKENAIPSASDLTSKTKVEDKGNNTENAKVENTEVKSNPVEDNAGKIAAKEPATEPVKMKEKKVALLSNEDSDYVEEPSHKDSTVRNIFTVELGADYLLGWKYDNTTEGRGLNPVVGVGFNHYFNKKWSFDLGIQYGSVSNLSNTQKVYTTTTYGFGAYTSSSIIDTKWIHYAVMPLFADYHFDNKNSVGLGATVAFLMNTTSDYITINNADFSNPVESKQTSTGYTEGLNQFNACLAAFYRRMLTDRLSVYGEIHYGLLDIKDDSFFGQNVFERSSGIKFLVSYDFSKH